MHYLSTKSKSTSIV